MFEQSHFQPNSQKSPCFILFSGISSNTGISKHNLYLYSFCNLIVMSHETIDYDITIDFLMCFIALPKHKLSVVKCVSNKKTVFSFLRRPFFMCGQQLVFRSMIHSHYYFLSGPLFISLIIKFVQLLDFYLTCICGSFLKSRIFLLAIK